MTYLLSSSSIASDSVRNTQGEDLGSIKDLMIDPNSGEVVYAILSFGGFLGLGDKYFAVPFNQLKVDRDNKCMVLQVAKDRLENAPGFDKDNWPDFADTRFLNEINSYYTY
ncbi:PRC-barrel domain-containing protein [Hirschia litorea]|uniref:PRC-barrel domain-containing protein n=1 Tax=Hirschia litorea TaxID=1199156 RepID=A0ABW2IPN0_9PROT